MGTIHSSHYCQYIWIDCRHRLGVGWGKFRGQLTNGVEESKEGWLGVRNDARLER